MATAEMTPLSFAIDRPNYSRWLPVYLFDMHELRETPCRLPRVCEGKLCHQSVWSPICSGIDGHGSGAIYQSGFQNDWRHYWDQPEAGCFGTLVFDQSRASHLHDLQDEDRVGTHKDASGSRKKRVEEDVVKLTSTVTSGLVTDPFSLDGLENEDADALPLINIATGVVMPAADVQRILQCYELGKT